MLKVIAISFAFHPIYGWLAWHSGTTEASSGWTEGTPWNALAGLLRVR